MTLLNVSVRLDQPTIDAIQALADVQQRSWSDMLRLSLRGALFGTEGATLEGGWPASVEGKSLPPSKVVSVEIVGASAENASADRRHLHRRGAPAPAPDKFVNGRKVARFFCQDDECVEILEGAS